MLVFNWLLFGNSDPVGINPTAIAFGISLYGHVAELGTNPLAFLHLELIATVLILLAVGAPGELYLRILDRKAQVDILMNAWLVVNLVNCRGLQRSNDLLRLRLAS